MKRLILSVISVLILSAGLAAQQSKINLPQLTDQQRWNRASTLFNSSIITSIALGKSKGMTVEETGNWLGKLYAPSWGRAHTPQSLFIGIYRNTMASPTAIMEVTASTENEIAFRMSRHYLPTFGDAGVSYGVTVQEYETAMMMVNKAIAEYSGLQIEQKIDGMWWLFTVSKKDGK